MFVITTLGVANPGTVVARGWTGVLVLEVHHFSSGWTKKFTWTSRRVTKWVGGEETVLPCEGGSGSVSPKYLSTKGPCSGPFTSWSIGGGGLFTSLNPRCDPAGFVPYLRVPPNFPRPLPYPRLDPGLRWRGTRVTSCPGRQKVCGQIVLTKKKGLRDPPERWVEKISVCVYVLVGPHVGPQHTSVPLPLPGKVSVGPLPGPRGDEYPRTPGTRVP